MRQNKSVLLKVAFILHEDMQDLWAVRKPCDINPKVKGEASWQETRRAMSERWAPTLGRACTCEDLLRRI